MHDAERALLVDATLARVGDAQRGWSDEPALRRRLGQSIDELTADGGGPGAATPAFGRSELIRAEGWIALAQPLPTAESLPSPHVILWYLGPTEDGDPWPSASVLDGLAAVAADRFQPLGTWRTAVFLHGERAALPAALAPGLRAYKRWMAAPMQELVESDPPPRSERVRVSTPGDLGFYPQYARMYEEFWESEPRLRNRIGMESRADLGEFRRHGGLRLIWIDDAFAGLVGAVRLTEEGLRGWRLRERVLGGAWRGGGFGAATLDAALRDLRHEPGDLVWGTILPENVGSLRSATRVGRRDIGGLWWL